MAKRKAQGAEMIGLIVIVILLVVILMVYMRFASKPQSTTSAASSNIENQNLIMAIIDATPCPGVSFRDAMQACNDGRDICSKQACDVAGEMVKSIITAYFGKELDRKPVTLHFVLKNAKGDVLAEIPDLKGKSIKQNCNIYMPANKTITPGLGNILIEQCA